MAKTKKAWLIPLNGGSHAMKRINELEGKELKLADLYPIIGNGCHTVERVLLSKGVELWVDEEGLLKQPLVINPIATFLYQHSYATGRGISPKELSDIGVVGTAVLIDNTTKGDYIHE